ncbi:hypothetical protein ACFY2R_17105 [Micromonospora olivasterospora]|uniref:Uncharacterized protein n=1 Tax=Micromonospora olivasterospora TaxID=1880 RepID=A0A562IBS1_MICOL|nr:hypothetical protein [Micromonospora olivasterospora]TWH68451.1 hypothetical protein JD77_03444 [Micromonospora olivasterospora]
MSCSECPALLTVTPGAPQRRTCSDACRQRRSRRLRAEAATAFRAQAADLLRRQTRAVIAGDAAELRRVEADAARLFAA